MKKLIIMSALVMGGLGINNAKAQLGFRINVNLGARPVYVPAPQPAEVVEQPVYDDDDYYYLPDVEAYYSVGEHCYYYQDGDNWVSAAYLPGMYRNFDWRTAKHYEIHSPRPYMHNEVYSARFGGFADRDSYYARAYPERGRYDNRYAYRGHEEYNNRGPEQYDNRNQNYNRGGYDRNDGRSQNNYSQPSQGRNQGGYNQPAPQQNNSYSQPSQGRNSQPSQGQQGGRNGGQGQNQGGNSQPANQNRGNSAAGDHYAANKMGVTQDRGEFARPIRN